MTRYKEKDLGDKNWTDKCWLEFTTLTQLEYDRLYNRGKVRKEVLKKTNAGRKSHPIKCNETEQIFNGIEDCANYFNVSPSYISLILHGHKRNNLNGYSISRADEVKND